MIINREDIGHCVGKGELMIKRGEKSSEMPGYVLLVIQATQSMTGPSDSDTYLLHFQEEVSEVDGNSVNLMRASIIIVICDIQNVKFAFVGMNSSVDIVSMLQAVQSKNLSSILGSVLTG